ncbi:MAG: hypothetical protein K1X94_00915 [Sandaracinaceae bacterium]|nr:hypothetical protein [Sandaracinaceae bacterium]
MRTRHAIARPSTAKALWLGLALTVCAPRSLALAGTEEEPPPPDACGADAGVGHGPDAGGGYVFSDPVAAPVVRFEPVCSAQPGASGDASLPVIAALGALVWVTRRRHGAAR